MDASQQPTGVGRKVTGDGLERLNGLGVYIPGRGAKADGLNPKIELPSPLVEAIEAYRYPRQF